MRFYRGFQLIQLHFFLPHQVNKELWDLDRPLETSCKLELLNKFDNEEAASVFWHSTAHVLGEAMERVYGGCLCYGPPIENGFYYDMFLDQEAQMVTNIGTFPQKRIFFYFKNIYN